MLTTWQCERHAHPQLLSWGCEGSQRRFAASDLSLPVTHPPFQTRDPAGGSGCLSACRPWLSVTHTPFRTRAPAGGLGRFAASHLSLPVVTHTPFQTCDPAGGSGRLASHLFTRHFKHVTLQEAQDTMMLARYGVKSVQLPWHDLVMVLFHALPKSVEFMQVGGGMRGTVAAGAKCTRMHPAEITGAFALDHERHVAGRQTDVGPSMHRLFPKKVVSVLSPLRCTSCIDAGSKRPPAHVSAWMQVLSPLQRICQHACGFLVPSSACVCMHAVSNSPPAHVSACMRIPSSSSACVCMNAGALYHVLGHGGTCHEQLQRGEAQGARKTCVAFATAPPVSCPCAASCSAF
eukprot:358019-Chlamydomonas_euryale.AAC.3